MARSRRADFPEAFWEIAIRHDWRDTIWEISRTLHSQLVPLRLALTIKNPEERSFDEIEATQSGWSVPELNRQLNSGLYERLALSRNNEQHRIVGKVDELMTLCDRVEAQLNTIQTESRRLLEAVLLDALNSAAA
jgi:hypothetical protein